MTDLPPGWTRATLGDLLIRIEAGKSFTCEPRPAEEDEWGVIKVSAMTWGTFREDENKAVPAHREIDPANEIRPGDILVSRANTAEYVGAPVLVGECRPRLLLSDKSLRLVPSSEVDRRWLLNVLASPDVRRAISARATGTKESMRNISQQALSEIEVLVPPQAEQQRIAAVLGDRLTLLSIARDELSAAGSRVPDLIDGIKTNALAAAASAPMRPLESLLREPLRNGYSGRASEDGKGVRTLTLTAVTRNQFTEANTKMAVADVERIRHLWLEPGDILIQRSNTPELVGTSALYNGEKQWAVFPDLLIRARVNADVLPSFVQLVLSSSEVRSYFRSSAKGLAGSMPKIDQGTILRTRIPVPPLGKQQDIVLRVALQIASAVQLGETIHRAEERVLELRNQLMRRAFQGNLVAQDPADEPADELLRRIRAEREAAVEAGRSRRSGGRSRTRSSATPSENAHLPSSTTSESVPVPLATAGASRTGDQEVLFQERELSS
ncbi:restriction endonuclease subunit S [Sphaerimonospora thailandensis]|uniref:Type I restriction enzyme S subunit n=1 Tax=Sphaerimonospora thailandensis TaxID=795644 RepID=A0A8J3W309_9ACTN|nr:hypothetical protein [Sphaerimonospora thailandensis]GIH73351.1 hypothetical protein Mth01_56040 [Sphaerimonospora thailandensis]